MLDVQHVAQASWKHDVLQHLTTGKCVAVICVGRFDAETKAEAFFETYSRQVAGMRRKDCLIEVFGKRACVEFVWLETRSGRRSDDYQEHLITTNDVVNA